MIREHSRCSFYDFFVMEANAKCSFNTELLYERFVNKDVEASFLIFFQPLFNLLDAVAQVGGLVKDERFHRLFHLLA